MEICKKKKKNRKIKTNIALVNSFLIQFTCFSQYMS